MLKWTGPNGLRQFATTGPTGLSVKCAKVYRSERFTTVCKDRSDRSLNEVSRSVPVRSVETTLLPFSAGALHPGTSAAGGFCCCCYRDSGDENHPGLRRTTGAPVSIMVEGTWGDGVKDSGNKCIYVMPSVAP